MLRFSYLANDPADVEVAANGGTYSVHLAPTVGLGDTSRATAFVTLSPGTQSVTIRSVGTATVELDQLWVAQ
jgi:hypothetical protein